MRVVHLLLLHPYLFETDIEDSMWSTRVLIHTCLVDLPLFHALLYILKKLLFSFDCNLCKAINKYPCFRIFSDLEPLVGVKRIYLASNSMIGLSDRWDRSIAFLASGGWSWAAPCWSWNPFWVGIEEICNMLHVYFKKRHRDPKLTLNRVLLDVIENLIHGSWNQSILKNRCSLFLRKYGFTSKNCVGLTRSRLPICHNDSVEPI